MAKRKHRKINNIFQIILPIGILVVAILFGVMRTQITQSNAETNPLNPTFAFNLYLDGIGTSGDSVNPNKGGNDNPVHKTRHVAVEVAGTAGGSELEELDVTYDSSSYSFKGTLTAGKINASGFYVRVKVPGYLKAQTKDVMTYPENNNVTVPDLVFVAGDATNDSKLDVADYNLIRDCFSILIPAKNCSDTKKLQTDITDDGLVNQYDYNLFLREISKHGGEDTSGGVVLPSTKSIPDPTATFAPRYNASNATLRGGTTVPIGQPISLNDVVSLKITGAMFVSKAQLADQLGIPISATLIPNGEQVLEVFYELTNTSQVGQEPLKSTDMMPFALFDDKGKRIDDVRPDNHITAQSTAIITTVPLSITKGPFLFLVPNIYNDISSLKLVINNATFSPVKSIIPLVKLTAQP